MIPAWKGVLPALVTPFDSNGKLDKKQLTALVDLLRGEGVAGVVVGGSTGEFYAMNVAERIELFNAVKAHVSGAFTLIAGTSSINHSETLQLTREAKAIGYDGCMVLPPVYCLPTPAEVTDAFTDVAGIGLPIMIYNNPIAYRVDVDVETLKGLSDIPKIVALKEETGDIRRVTDLRLALGDRFQLFLGVDDLAFEGLALGCDGLLAGVGCAFPRETVALYDLMKAGKYAEALKLYQWMTPMLHLDVSNKLVQNLKLIDLLVGVGTEHMRLPRMPLIGEERAFIEGVVKKALDTRPAEYQSVA